MTKQLKIFVAIVLVFSFSFMYVGYAKVTDSLSIEGSATVEGRVVIDYLYVSAASMVGGSSADKVGTMDGSKDASNPMGWVMLNLDFTSSLTKTVRLTVQNNNPTIKYMFYEPRVVSSYSTGEAEYTVSIKSGITPGQLNQQGLVYGGSTIASGASIENIEVTITSSEAVSASITLQMIFGFEGEEDKTEAESQATVKNALERFRDALNDTTMYNRILSEMSKNGFWQGDYVGNVVGSGDTDTQLVIDIFGDTLNKISFTEGGAEQTCTVMIKQADRTSKYSGEEMTLFMTTVDPRTVSNGTYIPVYAVVFVKDPNKTEEPWMQYSDIYLGEAPVNGYDWPHTGKDSFNTESWRVLGNQTFTVVINGSEKQYTITDNSNIKNAISKYESAIK